MTNASTNQRSVWQKPAHQHRVRFEEIAEGATKTVDLPHASFVGFAIDNEKGLAIVQVQGGDVLLYPPIVDDLHVALARAVETAKQKAKFEGRDDPTIPAPVRILDAAPSFPTFGPSDFFRAAGTDDGLIVYLKSEDRKTWAELAFDWSNVHAMLDAITPYRKNVLTLAFRRKSLIVETIDERGPLVVASPSARIDPRKALAREIKLAVAEEARASRKRALLAAAVLFALLSLTATIAALLR